ncbi:ERBB-3 BINDING PROTEIN 1 [Cucurbita argyrosperma subsp. argyrosperma]|nr:ERBB-3 BINDING PROTEIN 1 [Cucurbita argyrosperma subsp. argyrosperma]
MSSDDEREEVELDLSSPDVVTNYKNVAEIVNVVARVYMINKGYVFPELDEGNFAEVDIPWMMPMVSIVQNTYKTYCHDNLL